MNTVLVADDTPRVARPTVGRERTASRQGFVTPVLPSTVAPLLRPAFCTTRFPALLAFLIALSLELRSRRRRSRVCRFCSQSGLNMEDAFAATNLDGDAFLLSSFGDLISPADVIALFPAGNLDDFAVPQLINDGLPIEIIVLFQDI